MFYLEEVNPARNGYEFIVILDSGTKMKVLADYSSGDPGDRYSPPEEPYLDAYAWFFVFKDGSELRCNHDFITSSISNNEFMDALKKYYAEDYDI